MNVTSLAGYIYRTVAITVIKSTTESHKILHRKHTKLCCARMRLHPDADEQKLKCFLSVSLLIIKGNDSNVKNSPKARTLDLAHLIRWKDVLGHVTALGVGRKPKGSPCLNPCPRRSHRPSDLLLTDTPGYLCPKPIL